MKTIQVKNHQLNIRTEPVKKDSQAIRKMVADTGFFRTDEIEIAVELVDERLEKSLESGYLFFLAETDNILVGYTCYGLIPCSLLSWDLYWIVTRREYQGKGIGATLLKLTEEDIKNRGGKNVVIETSSKDLYKSTQQFYYSNGYTLKGRYEDFYDYGDDKLVYIKRM
ncbi:MAG: GNAT family N-acetyltransferase [Bacteroidales bacterium]|nr:GNAT family N-acetyltransferase [Bacteroidales bacterium]